MIYLKIGDITTNNGCDAIVNAANGIGILGGGVAGAILRAGGIEIEEEGKKICNENGRNFKEGEYYRTSSGKLLKSDIKYIYHAVTMEYPGGLSGVKTVEDLMYNVLKGAINDDIKSIAFPGLGTGVGGILPKAAAFCMLDVALQYHTKINIYFIDKNPDFIKAIKEKAGI